MGHYEVLGVAPDASVAEIRRCYLTLARSSHPDFHTESETDRVQAELLMRDINAAWAVLSDVDERSAYDRERMRKEGDRSPPKPQPFHATAAAHEAFHPFDDSSDTWFDGSSDRPITPTRLPAWLVMAPPSLLIGGIAGLALGSLTNIVGLLDIGLFSLLAAGVLFLVAPLVALGASRRGDRSR